MHKELSFTEDIIKEAARKLGVRDERVRGVYKSMIAHMHNLAKDEETISIRIPKLGVLYATIDGFKKKYYSTKEYRANKNVMLDKMESVDLAAKMSGRQKHSAHTNKRPLEMGYYTGHRSIENIQEIQNKRYHDKKSK